MRVLVAIGCDQYASEELPNLGGAENDASAMFESLVNSQNSIYDKSRSILLKSPTLEIAKEALTSVIFDDSGDMEVCLFFAGHGAVKDGAYFLCVNDTSTNRLSVSAISITELFMWINEANVRDTNIVIDACQAGGIAYDVAAFLKPRETGFFGSPSASVLAAAAADQAARERNGQGIATAAILKCLTGEEVVQTNRSNLSLIEIGPSVAELMSSEHQQAPVYWGLNLFGRSAFSRNPCFDAAHTPDIGLPDSLNRSVKDEPIIREHAAKVWELYLASSRYFDAGNFLGLTQSLLSDLPPDSEAAPGIVDALATTFRQLLNDSNDPFAEVELLGACIAALLPYVRTKDTTASVIDIMSRQLVESIRSSTRVTSQSIKENRFSLLSQDSAIADLYYLPIRILKIIGWIGVSQLIAQALDIEFQTEDQIRQELVREILDIYTCSIVAVSDEQTCSLVVFLRAAEILGLQNEAEQIFGLICHTFHKFHGKISHAGISGSGAYKFIKARAEGDASHIDKLISSPSEMLSALMLASEKLGLSDVIDEIIKDFDHMPGNLFVPDSYISFADKTILDGMNFSYSIGHDVWCVSDFMGAWEQVRTKIEGDSSLESPAIRIAAICASLIMPDRTPWFIWD